jgi:hypothetical protein
MNGLLGFHVQYHSSRLEMASQEICKIHLDCLPTNMKMKYEMKIQFLKKQFASNLGLVALYMWLEIFTTNHKLKTLLPHTYFNIKNILPSWIFNHKLRKR